MNIQFVTVYRGLSYTYHECARLRVYFHACFTHFPR